MVGIGVGASPPLPDKVEHETFVVLDSRVLTSAALAKKAAMAIRERLLRNIFLIFPETLRCSTNSVYKGRTREEK